MNLIGGARRPGGRRLSSLGWTLAELLVVTALIAVLLGIAAPALLSVMHGARLSSQISVLFSHLYLARSEAIKRNTRVVLCKSSDGQSCHETGRWDQGWIVFHDTNNNAEVDPGEAIVQRVPALSPDFVFTGNANVAHYVSYGPSGATRLTSGAFQAGTLTLCHRASLAGEARQIIISASGRARIHRTTIPLCG